MENAKSLMTYNADVNGNTSAAIRGLREVFQAAEAYIIKECPKSRRQSLALTHLETALMFAVKSVAMGE